MCYDGRTIPMLAVVYFLGIFIISVVSNAMPDIELTEENYNKTWMWMANGDSMPEIALLVEPPEERVSDELNPIHFEVYYDNPLSRLKQGNPVSFAYWFTNRKKRETWAEITDNVDPYMETKIIVHGWKSSSQSNSVQSIKNEYLRQGRYNVIAVNWKDQADNIYYLQPASFTVQVGRAIASLIDLLVENRKVKPHQIHLIGHSLGAHIMGYAGSYTKHRVGRITGLDPALPAFELQMVGNEGHLDPTDAEFVDVIHSCAGVLGFEGQLGTVDFYPNGGKFPQPGCGAIYQIITGCSHGRSYEYFAESISTETGFYAQPCKTLLDISMGQCNNGETILMGDKVPRTAKGVYYLKTKNTTAFAIGKPF